MGLLSRSPVLSRHSRPFALAALSLLLAGCAEDLGTPLSSEPEPTGPQAVISDGARGGNGHFYFLPPMVVAPTFTGSFAPGLSPEVQVCALAGTSCATQLALFTSSTNPAVTLQTATQNYQVNWATKPYNLSTSVVYRIRVRIGALELGFADLKVVAASKDLKSVGSGFVGLVKNNPLLIKFRIEQGAAQVLPPAGGAATVGPSGGALTTGDGAFALQITGGALAQNTNITVAPATTFPADPTLVSTVYDLGPDGTSFAGSGAILTLRYNPALLPAAIPEGDLKLYTAQTGGPWVKVANSSVNALDNTVTGTITHFSQGTVGAPVETIVVTPNPAGMPVGQTVQLAAELKDKQDRVVTNRVVTWSSSNPAVASVDGNGLVTGVAPGGATITAASEGKQGSAGVTVVTAIDLGTLAGVNGICFNSQPDSCNSQAFDINASGQVVGWSNGSVAHPFSPHAFLWHPNTPNGATGTMIDLGTLGGNASAAYGINAMGQVVGMATTVFNGTDHSFLWTPSTPNGTTGTMIELPIAGIPQAINNYGQVLISGGSGLSWLWTPSTANGTAGTTTPLLSTLGGTGTEAHDLNAYGQVVGWSGAAHNGIHAFLWTPTTPNGTVGSMTDLGTLGDGSLAGQSAGSNAQGINDMGQVVGEAYGLGSNPNAPVRTFLWTPTVSNGTSGTILDLGTMGGTFAGGMEISVSGEVAGYRSDASTCPCVPFLWRPAVPNGTTGTVVDFGTLGGSYAVALGLNGFHAVGFSERPSPFGTRATLWTIP